MLFTFLVVRKIVILRINSISNASCASVTGEGPEGVKGPANGNENRVLNSICVS